MEQYIIISLFISFSHWSVSFSQNEGGWLCRRKIVAICKSDPRAVVIGLCLPLDHVGSRSNLCFWNILIRDKVFHGYEKSICVLFIHIFKEKKLEASKSSSLGVEHPKSELYFVCIACMSTELDATHVLHTCHIRATHVSKW